MSYHSKYFLVDGKTDLTKRDSLADIWKLKVGEFKILKTHLFFSGSVPANSGRSASSVFLWWTLRRFTKKKQMSGPISSSPIVRDAPQRPEVYWREVNSSHVELQHHLRIWCRWITVNDLLRNIAIQANLRNSASVVIKQ